MADFLLLHGMNVGGWSWERVVAALQADPRVGKVVAPDMPGRGANRPNDFRRIRIGDYIATGVAALRDNDLRDAIVVGHSGGGSYLQAVVAAEPERVRRMVFLAAAVPERGRSLLELQPRPLRALSRVFFWLTRAGSRGIRPSKSLARRGMCHDLEPQDCDPMVERLVPEPLALLTHPIDWPAERVRVPATYVHTTLDRIVLPKHQERMVGNVPNAERVRLEMGHARPVADVEPLVTLLLRYAEPGPQR